MVGLQLKHVVTSKERPQVPKALLLHPKSQLLSLLGLSLELKHLSIFPSPSWLQLDEIHSSCMLCRELGWLRMTGGP